MVQAAVGLGMEDGKTLRVDTTVVETNIHYPTDATLLWDGVRVITRLMQDLHEKLADGVTGFTNRTRYARRRMQEIQRMTPKQRQDQQVPKYRQLIGVTEQVVENARAVLQQTERSQAVEGIDSLVIVQLRVQIRHFCQLADRVVDPTRRRVLDGEQVPSQQKIYSLFEPHTDLIKRGKAQKPVEFGHKVFLAESAQGLITDYRVLDGNPSDEHQVQASLDQHQQPSVTLRTSTGPIEASTIQTMCSAASEPVWPWSAFPSVAEPRPPSANSTRRARRFGRASGFERASKGGSRCCFAVVA